MSKYDELVAELAPRKFNTANLKKTYQNRDYKSINKFDRDAPTFKLSLSYKINNYKRTRRRKSAMGSM